ncbi:MAG: hypothetical protein JXI32_07245 [Deltaproteobacteria bacterium]|nr:hypothetical protein [Deltaproteobacteria bacterium]
MNKAYLNAIPALLVCLLVGLSTAHATEPFRCSAGATPEFEAVKELMPKVRESGAIPRSVKEDLTERYETIMDIDRRITDNTHPICVELFEQYQEVEDYEGARSSYEAETANYTSQCSGTFPEDQYRACMEWRSNLLAERQRLIDWKASLDQRAEWLNSKVNSMNEGNKNYNLQLLTDMKKALDAPVDIVVRRTLKPSSGGCTLGELWVNGEFFCYTLELPFENNNNNFSSIGVGRYDAFVGPTGRRPNGVIQLKNVTSVIYYNDNGTWRRGHINRNAGGPVEIHGGTEPGHSRGCICIADDRPDPDRCKLRGSGSALKRLYRQYFGDATRPDPSKKVTVTIQTAYE